MPTEFTIPELGENVKAGDVVRLLVKVGDVVALDQPLIELETDKATIEVPSTVAGVVKELKVKQGDKVKVGQAVLVVDGDGGAQASASASQPPAQAAAAPAEAQAAPPPASAGAAKDAGDDRGGDAPAADEQPEPAASRSPRGEVVNIRPAASKPPASSAAAIAAPAAPSVRRLARELGIDIADVQGTGAGGRISADDVTTHGKAIITGAAPAAGRAVVRLPLPDFAKWGAIERQRMSGVRRKTAEHLSGAWTAIPHVTQCDKADITALDAVRARFAPRVDAAGGKLTVTAIALKIVAAAMKVFPKFNASVDMDAEEIVLKKYTHIGVAVDTDRGLLVPVIRDVDRKNIVELSVELARLSEKARARKLGLDEMEGGCFSISNLGGIGGSYFTPIVNYPEVAILGISRARTEPVFVDGQFQPRLLLPLSLSYDHRVIDGADGIRFLRWVVEALEQPFLVSLEG